MHPDALVLFDLVEFCTPKLSSALSAAFKSLLIFESVMPHIQGWQEILVAESNDRP